jgi:Mg2+/citrate symporter
MGRRFISVAVEHFNRSARIGETSVARESGMIRRKIVVRLLVLVFATGIFVGVFIGSGLLSP